MKFHNLIEDEDCSCEIGAWLKVK